MLCDVVWRQVDADWRDPLELSSSSRIGVSGLSKTIRQSDAPPGGGARANVV
ncbi:MAG TPA: hypothetical protein VFE63_03355 [Roseiarcus sp.]|nr:hypothetical protein [Roseiarcus sp.]